MPHVRRLVVGTAIVGLRFALGPAASQRAELVDNLLVLAEVQAHRRAHHEVNRDRDSAAEMSVEEQQALLLLASRLQHGVQAVLATLNGHTLTVDDERDRAGELYNALAHVLRALELGDDRSVPAGLEPPSMTELQQQLDHDLNRELARRAQAREELAVQRQASELEPARWRLTRYEDNGFFQAHLDNGDGLLGPVTDGWAPVPEAVPSLLRAWNTPPWRPLDLHRQCRAPWPPDYLLPYGGYSPGHRGHDDDHTRTLGEGFGDLLWEEGQQAHRARFAAVIRHVKDTWPAGADVMRERTIALNATQPRGDLRAGRRPERDSFGVKRVA